MIRTILKRWLTRLIPVLTVIMAAVGVFHSVWRVVAGIAFVGLGMVCICKCILWPDKDEEPVTHPVPINPSPTIIPMPTVHLEPVDLPMVAPLIPTPYADVMDAWLRAEQRAMQEKLRGNDEDGDGVEV